VVSPIFPASQEGRSLGGGSRPEIPRGLSGAGSCRDGRYVGRRFQGAAPDVQRRAPVEADARIDDRLLRGQGEERQEPLQAVCVLERNGEGLSGPAIVLLDGMVKGEGTAFSEADYARIRDLAKEYRARTPRNVL
jgi:hypothetical protein